MPSSRDVSEAMQRLMTGDYSRRAAALARFLRDGTPAIYPRSHLINVGLVAFDPRPLTLDDARVIVQRVRSFFEDGSGG